ncbi:MAG: efflux RND transporter permease subunit [Bacteroidia bacterium]|nr:efflux RND transporter permease subunit [Bacteroidia bacterium]
MKDVFKEFKPSSWSIDNKTTIFILTVIITLAGMMTYNNLPKENFPDISLPQIFVSVVHPGTSPADMENLVAKPIEKQVKGASGVKKVTSNSVQDFTSVIVEFNTDVPVADAKQRVKDAVDKARSDLPNDLKQEPSITDINFSEIPILFVNISGDMELNKLKKYADDIKDKIESMKEISRVEMVGALEREIQINVDMYKMQSAQISMGDIERAVKFENMSISGGTVSSDGVRRTIGVKGEFKNVEQIRNIVVSGASGATAYLKDIADIKDTYKEQESFARLDHKNVITLNVVKRTGYNLIEATDKIKATVAEMQERDLPKNLAVTMTGDQSDQTRTTLHDLINTIIIGFILVLLILMFFMGTTNAFFVAMSVPLSMFLAFMVMPALGFTMNMIVLFSFLLALGIVVDDAIVVIENTHRLFENGKRPIKEAAKLAAGEVFLPVLSGTLTTLAPFVPLAFWTGTIGEFMFYLPITLIVTLLASLVVAYIINPVFAVQFMKPHNEEEIKNPVMTRGLKVSSVVLIALSLLFHLGGGHAIGNLMLLTIGFNFLNHFYLQKLILKFQDHTWPKFKDWYARKLEAALHWPKTLVFSTIVLFFVALFGMIARAPDVVFFPSSDPNFIYAYIKMPIGTDQATTDSVARLVETRVYKAIGDKNPIVSSVITNVAVGTNDANEFDPSVQPHKAKITVAFKKFSDRNGISSRTYLTSIRESVKGIPGVEISVDQEQGGPPVGKPINIEIRGDQFEDLVKTGEDLTRYLEAEDIAGVEQLKSDFETSKPEIVFNIDRERANREGISTAQIGMEIRNAVFGNEVSKFRDANDEYPIQLRYQYDQRTNVDALKNSKITFRDMNMGGVVRQVPLSSFCDIQYSSTYGGIKRINQKRVITVNSNVLSGYDPNSVVMAVQKAVEAFPKPDGIEVALTGQQEEQAETMSFLGTAMLVSLGLIFLILVTQFNSLSKPVIILTEIIFSMIGVFLGYAITGMTISTIMMGVGIVALAGIVVRNGILLVEFTDVLKEQGMNTWDAIIEAGKTRMTPVLLTACATMLGLIPLAVGLNIDFEELLTTGNPHLFFGGDSVAFWGPLSWTMIFGLAFATFLTLILVPVMYLLSERLKEKWNRLLNKINGHPEPGLPGGNHRMDPELLAGKQAD